MWPLFYPRTSQDPSWLYCGLATNAALYSGLHHAKPLQPPLRVLGVAPTSIHSRVHAWLGTFLASSYLSMFNGLPPLIAGVAELDATERFVREYPIPREFAYQVMVQRVMSKFMNVLMNDAREPINYSLVQLVDGELDNLRTSFPTEWTPRVEFNALVAKMHLYGMAVLRVHHNPSTRDIILKLGLSSSLRIIYLAEAGLGFTSDSHPGIQPPSLYSVLPKNYFRGVLFTCIFLIRYFALNTRATTEEQEVARNHLAIAHKILQSGSIGNLVDCQRAAILIEILGRQEPSDADNVKLRIDSRMGASLILDAITTSHTLIGRETIQPPIQPQPLQYSPNSNETAPEIANQSAFDFGVEGFGSMDFSSLPEDLWGDNLWTMFDMGPPV
ncbi:hypothetical protein K491DRAFT_705345 [Lophiostoma macrostomum CBS 122681]|uniref:Transcription factor domain-containing protein n=1 Tax=Lophiostoma macrostomum CBS 122681 TaxID=1314788 RepID=A0A6A6T5Z3_9PLEO|nr:hypothetical protein K491DRAFT_705345 [Lophiostoma macrostomum CBS 122681]